MSPETFILVIFLVSPAGSGRGAGRSGGGEGILFSDAAAEICRPFAFTILVLFCMLGSGRESDRDGARAAGGAGRGEGSAWRRRRCCGFGVAHGGEIGGAVEFKSRSINSRNSRFPIRLDVCVCVPRRGGLHGADRRLGRFPNVSRSKVGNASLCRRRGAAFCVSDSVLSSWTRRPGGTHSLRGRTVDTFLALLPETMLPSACRLCCFRVRSGRPGTRRGERPSGR